MYSHMEDHVTSQNKPGKGLWYQDVEGQKLQNTEVTVYLLLSLKVENEKVST